MKCSFALSLIVSTTIIGDVIAQAICNKETHVDRRFYNEHTVIGLVTRMCQANTVFVREQCSCKSEQKKALPREQVPDQKKAAVTLLIEQLPVAHTRSRSNLVTQQSQQQQQRNNQQYMTDILRVSWRLLIRSMDIRTPLAVMNKPCPCEVKCCAAPTEPRRVLQFVDVPMVRHPGCCGCVDCPPGVVSSAPHVSRSEKRRRFSVSRRRRTRLGGRF